MAENMVDSGEYVTVAAAANAVAGRIVVIGQMFGVAMGNALTGETLTLKTGGVWDFAKLNAASMSMAAGANVYWDAAGNNAVANATGNTRIGVALAAVTNAATTVRVRLNANF